MNNDDWLKVQCNRHTNGMCHTRGCLVRGGYDGIGPVNYAKATCEAHEILAELEALRRAIAQAAIAKAGDVACPNCGKLDMQVEVTTEIKPDCIRKAIHCNYCGHRRPL